MTTETNNKATFAKRPTIKRAVGNTIIDSAITVSHTIGTAKRLVTIVNSALDAEILEQKLENITMLVEEHNLEEDKAKSMRDVIIAEYVAGSK
jgi:hypothetical protein